MDEHQKLDVIFSNIVIPMVCTYNSDLFKNHCEESNKYFEDSYRNVQLFVRPLIN